MVSRVIVPNVQNNFRGDIFGGSAHGVCLVQYDFGETHINDDAVPFRIEHYVLGLKVPVDNSAVI